MFETEFLNMRGVFHGFLDWSSRVVEFGDSIGVTLQLRKSCTEKTHSHSIVVKLQVKVSSRGRYRFEVTNTKLGISDIIEVQLDAIQDINDQQQLLQQHHKLLSRHALLYTV